MIKLRWIYEKCFRDSKTVAVTRILCLDAYVRSSGLSGNSLERILEELPEVVAKLYKSLEKLELK